MFLGIPFPFILSNQVWFQLFEFLKNLVMKWGEYQLSKMLECEVRLDLKKNSTLGHDFPLGCCDYNI